MRKIAILSILIAGLGLSAFEIGFPPLFDYDEKMGGPGMDDQARFLGPFIEFSGNEKAPVHSLNAFRPIVSSERIPDNYAFDILWPLFVYRENNFEKYWRFALLYSGCDKPEKTNIQKPHTGFIPLWLYGWDENDKFYWVFFPIYGEAKHLISYDSMYFILFPIYLSTKKNKSEGESYLWPIVNWDRGPDFHKVRVIPFYALHEKKNSFRRVSYMWPFFHRAKYYSEKTGGDGWMLWPIFGKNKFNRMQSYSFLWPLFSLHFREPDVEGKNDGFGYMAPWPILQYKRNADRDDKNEKWKFYLWPLFGRSERMTSTYQFLLWPIASSLCTFGGEGKVDWLWVLPLYWSKHAENAKGKTSEVYRHFWPFASYVRKDNFSEIRVFDIWIQRNMPVVDRNWTPLWVLYDYQRRGETFRHDFLWGAFKYSLTPEEGGIFSIFPFYRSNYDIPETKNSEDKPPSAIRDYGLGIVRTIKARDDSLRMRLLWFLNFDL